MNIITQISNLDIWVLIGILMLISEIFIIQGIGLLFLGLGCLTMAFILCFIDNITIGYQISIMGFASSIWFFLLWSKLKKFMSNTNKKNTFDIIGSKVIVLSKEIKPGDSGKVKWSGTIMNAKLASGIKESVFKEQVLYVVSIEGNILICENKLPTNI